MQTLAENTGRVREVSKHGVRRTENERERERQANTFKHAKADRKTSNQPLRYIGTERQNTYKHKRSDTQTQKDRH